MSELEKIIRLARSYSKGGPMTESLKTMAAEIARLREENEGLQRLVSQCHDAMVEAEDALTEFCGHNDETRGGWALQSLSRAIDAAASSAGRDEGKGEG